MHVIEVGRGQSNLIAIKGVTVSSLVSDR